MALDSGYDGRIKSLAGVSGGVTKGLKTEHQTLSFGAVQATILTANPMRKYAIIQVSPSSAEKLILSLGEPPTGGVGLEVLPGGSYQIDDTLPWTGAVIGTGGAGGCQMNVVEASVQL